MVPTWCFLLVIPFRRTNVIEDVYTQLSYCLRLSIGVCCMGMLNCGAALTSRLQARKGVWQSIVSVATRQQDLACRMISSLSTTKSSFYILPIWKLWCTLSLQSFRFTSDTGFRSIDVSKKYQSDHFVGSIFFQIFDGMRGSQTRLKTVPTWSSHCQVSPYHGSLWWARLFRLDPRIGGEPRR